MESASSQLPVCPGKEGRKQHTQKKEEKEKKRKEYINNLRDKAPATEPNLFQAPAAAFGHLD